MSLDDLLAEARRLSRQAPPAPRALQLPAGLRGLADEAHDVRVNGEKARRKRIREEHSRLDIDRQMRLDYRYAEQAEMDNCPMRHESVRGKDEYECSRRLRVCYLCGRHLPPGHLRWCSAVCSQAWWGNHLWGEASFAAKKRDGQKCVRCGSGNSLEVNHIIPRNGGGYEKGCAHHQDLLETLCHPCHVVVTNQQRAERTAQRQAAAS